MGDFIRRNHSTASPSSLLFFDCESLPSHDGTTNGVQEQRLWFGHSRYVRLENGEPSRRDECTFTDVDTFWRFVLGKCQRGQVLWIFAHNIAYDLTLTRFWEDMARGDWTMEKLPYTKVEKDGTRKKCKTRGGMFVDGDPPVIIKCRHVSGADVVMLDTVNYFGVPLRDLGDSIGMSKLEMPHIAAPDAAWTKYCVRDCEILERAILKLISWIGTNDLGMFRWSAPSQAMGAWRHRFMPKEMDISRSDAVKSVERQAYYGGRIECCYVGEYKHDVYELDVNSMFPSVMAANTFPYQLDDSWEQSGSWHDNYSHPHCYTAAECIVETGSVPYPVRLKDGTYWCTGRFWTTLAGPELQDAWERGHVKCIGRWATYRMRNLFSSYVDFFWDQRMAARTAGDMATEALCKMFLNSLYGKFGQQSPQWVDCECPSTPWLWGRKKCLMQSTGEWREFRSIAGHYQMAMEPAEHPKSFAAISAWVTSYARLKIRQLAEIAGVHNVLYVVTDALYTNRDGYLNLQNAGEVNANELGKMKLRRYGSEAAFWGANDYLVGTNRVLSGVRANAVPVGSGLYRETVFEGLSDIVSREPDGSVRVSERLVAVQHKVKRVDVGDDGWTRPIRIIADGIIHLNRLRRLRRLPTLQELMQ